MDPSPQESGGISAAARGIASSLFGLVQTRVELFALELQEEKLRTVRLLVWLSVATALGAAAILVTIGALALFLWRAAGYAGLAGVAGGTLLLAAGLFWFLRQRIVNGPEPFEATIAEFRKDAECLRRKD